MTHLRKAGYKGLKYELFNVTFFIYGSPHRKITLKQKKFYGDIPVGKTSRVPLTTYTCTRYTVH